MSKSPQKPNRKRLWIAVIIVCAVTAILGIALRDRSAPSPLMSNGQITTPVRRGNLVISLTESGTIQAQNRIVIKNTIPGNTSILWIIEEGKQVKKGDLLVELESSALEEKLFSQQITVQNAESLFVRARENLSITKSQAASDVEKSETLLQFAHQDLETYTKGQYPQQLREAEVSITLAEEDLQRAEERLKWSRKLLEQKFISQSELQADDLAAKKATLNLELARGKKQLLEAHTYERELAQLQSDARQNAMALERARSKAKANILQAEAEFTAKEMEFSRQRDKLAKIEEEITATRIKAPSDGLVVYATSANARRHNNTEPLAEGRIVREREALIHLPDITRMMASIKVHETHVKKITIGMRARITVEALPQATFTGYVKQIAPLPDATSFWMNPDLKVYDTEIYVDSSSEGLRNGMTCEVEIVAEQHTNALFVPIQSVVREGSNTVAFVADAHGPAIRRVVEVGGDNNRMVHILKGLSEGERVLLTPPLRNSVRDETAALSPPIRTVSPPAKSKRKPSPEKHRDRKTKK